MHPPSKLRTVLAGCRHGWLLLLVAAGVWWVRTVPLEMRELDAWAQRLAVAEALDGIRREQGSVDPAAVRTLAADPAVRARREALAEVLRDQKTFVAEDGSRHVYLGGFDGYGWLRLARNQLERGSPCDEIVDGRCRDQLTIAPWGAETTYGRSLYVTAIVVVHKLFTLWNPQYPLSSSAYQLQVILGLLAVLPAFYLGCRLGGTAGGVTASVVASLNLHFLIRSFRGDNDAWNVVLLLFLMAALMAAVLARGRPAAFLYVLSAALFSSLWAASWEGWAYGYLLAAAVLGARVVVLAVRRRPIEEIRYGLALVAVYYLATGLGVAILQRSPSAFTLPLDLLARFFADAATPAGDALHWPDVFATVGELSFPSLERIVRSVGGRAVFVLAYLGLLLVCLPAADWRHRELAVLAGGALAPGLLLSIGSTDDPVLILSVLAVPVLAALALRLATRSPDPGIAAGILMAAWCLSTFWLSVWSERFLLLFGVPWAIALGAAVGQLHGWLAGLLEERGAWIRRSGQAALAIALAGGLSLVTRDSIAAVPRYLPGFGDATVEALETLRETTPEDAIVTDLWEHGYWVKYFARRRVHHDGGSLSTHVPYWVGRFYAAADDRRAVGLLRMLNCGSDATPLPEGEKGAWQRLQAAGKTPADAFRLVDALTALDRGPAAELLRRQGLSSAQSDEILARTHCQPPESLIVAGDQRLTKIRAWLTLAEHDPLGGSGLGRSEDRLSSYPQWWSCRPPSPGSPELRCDLGRTGTRPRHDIFTIDLERPEDARLHRRGSFAETRRPGLVALFEDGGVRHVEPENPDFPDLGALVDRHNRRVLISRANLLRSTMARLTLIEGYESPFFEPLAVHSDPYGETVKLWRVRRWE